MSEYVLHGEGYGFAGDSDEGEVTIIVASVGDDEPDAFSYSYQGSFAELSGARGYTPWSYGAYGMKRAVVWGNGDSKAETGYWEHKHTGDTNWHKLVTASFVNCYYGYDCQTSNMYMRVRIYSDVSFDPSIYWYSTCKNSCSS